MFVHSKLRLYVKNFLQGRIKIFLKSFSAISIQHILEVCKYFAEIIKTGVFSRLVPVLQNWSQLISKIWRFSTQVFKKKSVYEMLPKYRFVPLLTDYFFLHFSRSTLDIRIFTCHIFGTDCAFSTQTLSNFWKNTFFGNWSDNEKNRRSEWKT